MASYVLPLHIQIYQREGVKWFIYEVGAPFYNPTSTPMNTKHVASQLNMTEEQVIIELFRINGGKPGFYLASLRDHKYYYCGLQWEDIRYTLQSLGIGRSDPAENIQQ